MYKIAIIDDEQIVREGIRDLVDWQALGLEVVGDAEDGEKGYALIEEKRPDIILLDINMPKINGLELTRMIREKYKDMKIILITGYDEFGYAREALRLGVEDYILKPVTKAEITELLRNLVLKLETEEKQKKQRITMARKIEKSTHLLRQELLRQLIYGDIDSPLAQKRAEDLGIPIDKKKYAIVLLEGDKNEIFDNDVLLDFALDNIISEWLEDNNVGINFRTEGLKHAILYYRDIDDVRSEKFYIDTLEEVKNIIEEYLNTTISIGAGKLVEHWDDLSNSYYEAKVALGQRFFLGNSLIIKGGEELTAKVISQPNNFIQIEEEFLKKVQVGDSTEVEKLIEEIGNMMEGQQQCKEDCQAIWIQLSILMLKKFVEMDKDIIHIFNRDIDIYTEIYQCKTLQEVKEWVKGLYRECNEFIKERSTPNKIYMIKILSYIDENYHEKDLSMTTVCDHVHLSVSYFSSIFKKETGKTFIQYLTEIRLKNAKKLLKNMPLKTYEIANKVGYSDPHYFSSSFRKQYGMTPSQYRKKSKG